MNIVVIGLLAGFAATVPMTLVMIGHERFLLRPFEITAALLRRHRATDFKKCFSIER